MALERQRLEDVWSSPASQPSLEGEFQTVRDLVSKHEVGRGGYIGGDMGGSWSE